MKKNIFVIAVLMFAMTFCFAASKKEKAEKTAPMPKWVNTPSAVYSAQDYLVSVGEGFDRSAAEVKAVQGIAATFKQDVKSDETAKSVMVQARKDGVVATAQISSFDQQVMRSVNEDDLIGIEIKEYWNDTKNNKWYAIAVMEKNKTAELYKDLIKANIASINKMLNEINGNTIDSYTCCKFAVEVSKINEGYYSRLAVLKPAESNFLKDDMYSPKKLQLRALEIANNIPVCIVIENDVNGQIAQAFASVFKNLGFKTTFNPGSRYMVAGSVTFSESKTSDNKTIHCKYVLDSYLADTQTDKNIIPFSLNGRAANITSEGAKTRAVNSIVKKINEGFAESLNGYMTQFFE